VVLNSLGFGAGDTMHVVIGNNNAKLPLAFGAWILGGTFSSGDVNLEARAVAHQLKDTQPKLLVCSPATLKLTSHALDECQITHKPKLLCFGPDLGEENNLLAMEKQASVGQCPDHHIPEDPTKPTKTIFWTSGTTGILSASNLWL